MGCRARVCDHPRLRQQQARHVLPVLPHQVYLRSYEGDMANSLPIQKESILPPPPQA